MTDEHEKGTNFTRTPQRTCNREETQLWHLTSHNMPFAVAASAAARASTTAEPAQQRGGTSAPTPAPRTPRAPQLPHPIGVQRARSRFSDNNQESTSKCLCNCARPASPTRPLHLQKDFGLQTGPPLGSSTQGTRRPAARDARRPSLQCASDAPNNAEYPCAWLWARRFEC